MKDGKVTNLYYNGIVYSEILPYSPLLFVF